MRRRRPTPSPACSTVSVTPSALATTAAAPRTHTSAGSGGTSSFTASGARPRWARRRSHLREIAEAAAADAEQQAIRRVLQVTSGNKSEAARLLRTDYKTLYLKLKQYGIDAGRFRELRAP